MRSLRRRAARWRSRTRELGEQWHTRREIWRIEREIEDVVAGSGPILVGPWLSEVGYEVLYWVPFVRWVQSAYRIAPERLMVVSRGGVSSWYSDITPRYREALELVPAAEYAADQQRRTARGESAKQLTVGALDRRLIDALQAELGGRAAVLHPSLMYRLFAAFWSGHESVGFVERRTRVTAVKPPDLDVSALGLPLEYVAAKFYTARALPQSAASRRLVGDLVAGIARHVPVVLLDSGTVYDEHVDFAVDTAAGRISTVGDRLTPATNLAVQTRIIAGARGFVGTCGSVAWLAPMLGIDTTAILVDARLLHAHLHIARRAYHRLGRGAFTPLELGGLAALGVSLQPAGAGVHP